ncbi:MAG: hypothetical protein ACXIUD_03670 [Mongoliitalea sp.]
MYNLIRFGMLVIAFGISSISIAQTDIEQNLEERKAYVKAKIDSVKQVHHTIIMKYSTDSLQIKAIGEGNQIQLDSLKFNGPIEKTLKGSWMNGKIQQNGIDNTIDIQSGKKSSSPQQVEIKQSGNNNRVVIRSGSIDPK